MKLSVRIVAITNVFMGLLTVLMRWLQFREPDPFEHPYATVSALTLLGFLFTWAYVAVALVVLWSSGNRLRAPWLYLWTLATGLFVVWFLVGLVQFLFP